MALLARVLRQAALQGCPAPLLTVRLLGSLPPERREVLGAATQTLPVGLMGGGSWGPPLAAQLMSTAVPGKEGRSPSASTSGLPVRPSPKDFATLSADAKLYKEYLDDARHRIFGDHIGNGERSGRKVLRKKLVGDRVVDWYMINPAKMDAIFKDPLDDQKKKKLATLKRRGKGPPPKGQGKRAKKK